MQIGEYKDVDENASERSDQGELLLFTKKGPCPSGHEPFRKAAAAYSPTWWGSTIGASELNFSVRYGKRWILTAITTAV